MEALEIALITLSHVLTLDQSEDSIQATLSQSEASIEWDDVEGVTGGHPPQAGRRPRLQHCGGRGRGGED